MLLLTLSLNKLFFSPCSVHVSLARADTGRTSVPALLSSKNPPKQSSVLTLGDAGCSAKLSYNCCLHKLCLLYLIVILSMVWVTRQSMCVAIWISVPCVPGIWCWRLRYPRWWQTYRICTAQHQLNNGPRRWFPTENPRVHICNASVSLKKNHYCQRIELQPPS